MLLTSSFVPTIYPPWCLPTEQMSASENTVKAHPKKIYAKMGVHSRNGFERILPMR